MIVVLPQAMNATNKKTYFLAIPYRCRDPAQHWRRVYEEIEKDETINTCLRAPHRQHAETHVMLFPRIYTNLQHKMTTITNVES